MYSDEANSVSAGFSMAVSTGSLQPITVDGGYPVNNETASAKAIGLLYPGERIDLVLDRTTGYAKLPANLTIELDRECVSYITPYLYYKFH